ncbi:MAG: pyruvate kinase alpha/beta domain-containing protein [Bacillota bacterium]
MTVYFDRPGRENTGQVAVLALNRAKELGIQYIVVASNTGYTADFFAGKGIKAVCVTHHIGFREPGSDEMSAETRENLKSQGVELLTTTHLFGNVERAVTNKFGGLYPGGLISHTLRMFSQGTKVAVEIAVMALDAGLIPFGEPVIAVGGSGRGADTALVLTPAHAKAIFDTEILEIICKPRRPKE